MNIQERIRQRRAQILIHSFLYYHLDSPIISDITFDRWSKELVDLQKECKEIYFYDQVFSDWDGSTGYHLPVDGWIAEKGTHLLRYHDEHTATNNKRTTKEGDI